MSGIIDVGQLGSLAVDAGNLFVFDRRIDALTRSDVLDSDLLSQLAADKQVARLEDPNQWIAKYQNYLNKIFWQDINFGVEKFEPETPDFLIEPILLESFGKYCSREELETLEQNLTKFADLSSDARGATVYDGFTQSERIVCVSASFVRPPAEMISVIVYFETGEPITRSFTQIFRTSLLETKIGIATYLGSLSESRYAEIREDVIRKLGTKRKEYIVNIK